MAQQHLSRQTLDDPEIPVSWEFAKRDWDSFYDEHTALQLDTAATHLAMAEELKYMEELGLLRPVPVDQCMERPGTLPIPTRWVL